MPSCCLPQKAARHRRYTACRMHSVCLKSGRQQSGPDFFLERFRNEILVLTAGAKESRSLSHCVRCRRPRPTPRSASGLENSSLPLTMARGSASLAPPAIFLLLYSLRPS